MPPETFLEDPGRRSLALRELARSLGLRALLADTGSLWDLKLAGLRVRPWPPAVEGGLPSHPPSGLEAARRASPTLETVARLAQLLPTLPIGVVLTGPGRFEQLTGNPGASWAPVLLEIAQLALEAGARLLLVWEEALPTHLSLLEPLWATATFWQAQAALVLEREVHLLTKVDVPVPVLLPESALTWIAPSQAWGAILEPEGTVSIPPGGTLFTTPELYGRVPIRELPKALARLRGRIGG